MKLKYYYNNVLVNKIPVLAVTIFFIIYVVLPFLAPILEQVGQPGIASIIYKIYSFLCHQRAERSLFLFGEKISYSIAELKNIGLINLYDLRNFIGEPELGYKLALCFRDLGLYSSLAISGIIVLFIKKPIKPLHWKFPLLATIPMFVDGGLQFIAEVIFYSKLSTINILESSAPFYVSNNINRVVTGLLLGFTVGFWLYPSIIKEFSELKDRSKQKESAKKSKNK